MTRFRQMQIGVRAVVVAVLAIGYGMPPLQIARSNPEVPQTAQTYLERGNFVAAYKNRGLVHIQSGRHFKEALADYNQALELAPNDAASYLGKGLTLSLEGRKREALEPLNQAIKLDPKLAIAYFTRASVYHDLGEKAAALINYRKAADLYQQQGNQAGYRNTTAAIDELK